MLPDKVLLSVTIYGSVLWSLSSPAVKMIEVSLNNASYYVRYGICLITPTLASYTVWLMSPLSVTLYNRSLSMFSSAMTSSNLVKYIFIGSSKLVYSSTGYNFLYGHEHLRFFSDNDYCTASIIRDWIVLSL